MTLPKAQRLYRELIKRDHTIDTIDHAFSFHLLGSVKQTPLQFKLIDATLFIPEVGCYMNCLDCGLELGTIPVSCSKRLAAVCDYTPHMY